MNRKQLIEEIKSKQSFLCVGLDTDITKIPKHLLSLDNPILEFNKQVIDATKDFCVAYKPNIAFYECLGSRGWDILQETLAYIPDNIFTIADAKRGDIGNTASMYAKTFLEKYQFDSVTVAPYMGNDSVKPFLAIPNKWTILLGLTSNEGALDFQFIEDKSGLKVYEHVLNTSKSWGTVENLMYVIGATKAEYFQKVRAIIPNHFLLVPGVGAQGGNLQDVCKQGINSDCGLLINSSRGILYASQDEDFAEVAAMKAKEIQREMSLILKQYQIIS
ncbi:MAG: orotidine-5'-phosphate decarboxylase [Flavobacteriales bacterium]|nr:orotidine-5'-phosphate decarboxylase [Flavobacteriales bacterium]